MTETKQLTAAFERLGASPANAATMAAQLLKRADQLAGKRGVTRAEALARLLELVVKGRTGEVPGDFAPPVSRPPRPEL